MIQAKVRLDGWEKNVEKHDMFFFVGLGFVEQGDRRRGRGAWVTKYISSAFERLIQIACFTSLFPTDQRSNFAPQKQISLMFLD